jgi:hypothetical protein
MKQVVLVVTINDTDKISNVMVKDKYDNYLNCYSFKEVTLPLEDEIIATAQYAVTVMHETNPAYVSYYIAGEKHIIDKLN